MINLSKLFKKIFYYTTHNSIHGTRTISLLKEIEFYPEKNKYRLRMRNKDNVIWVDKREMKLILDTKDNARVSKYLPKYFQLNLVRKLLK